jgi:hypothetical protein
MEQYLDQNYLDYICDKKVALVGPAEYLTKLKLGNLIDDYDIVVRVNRGLEVISAYPESVGVKTNILYNCLLNKLDNGGNLDINFFKSKGVEWISTIPYSDYNGNCRDNSLHPMADSIFANKAKAVFNFHLMDWHDYSYINKNVKCRANTGFSAIFDLLNHKPSELFICGYSFYLDSFQKGYKKGCERDEHSFAKDCFKSKRHIQPNQWNYLKEIFNNTKNIKVDPILDKILKMKNLSHEEFKKIL